MAEDKTEQKKGLYVPSMVSLASSTWSFSFTVLILRGCCSWTASAKTDRKPKERQGSRQFILASTSFAIRYLLRHLTCYSLENFARYRFNSYHENVHPIWNRTVAVKCSSFSRPVSAHYRSRPWIFCRHSEYNTVYRRCTYSIYSSEAIQYHHAMRTFVATLIGLFSHPSLANASIRSFFHAYSTCWALMRSFHSTHHGQNPENCMLLCQVRTLLLNPFFSVWIPNASKFREFRSA